MKLQITSLWLHVTQFTSLKQRLITIIHVRIAGIFQSVIQDNRRTSSNVTFLRILELCELGLFLILAVIANLARSRSGLNYQRARTAFWVATIVVVILWSISSLLSIVTSGHATPGNIITMAATVVIAVIMIADELVIAWNHIDPSTITDQEGHRDLSEPLVSASDKREEREGRLAARKEQERLSQAESGEVIHVVDPYPEKWKAPAHGTGNPCKTAALQPADDPDFLEWVYKFCNGSKCPTSHTVLREKHM